jgi:DNA-binding transcriptional MocR family regulator
MAIATAAELVADIEARIVAGDLLPGHRLTPVRTASRQLGLAPNTVAVAYRQLAQRGLVQGQGRRGTFVATRPSVVPTRFEHVPAGMVDLSHGNPDPVLLPDLASGAVAALRDLTRPVLYGEPTINEAFARAVEPELVADLGPLLPDGLEADRNLAVVGGALDGIERTLQAHLVAGDLVAVEDPGYNSVFDLLRAMSLRTEPVAVDGEGVQADELAAALDRGARAVVLTPRAHNPTGAALSSARACELRDVLAGHPEVLVIEDDHAGPVAGSAYRGVIPEGHRSWAVIRSMAKALGPDLRVAALVADTATVARVIGRQSLGVGWVSTLLQRTAAQLLNDDAVTELLDQAGQRYAERRATVVDGLAARGITVSAHSGLNVWVPVDDEAAVVAAMQQRGFALRSGARFRLRSGPAVRISTAAQPVEVLAEATEVLAEVLSGGQAVRPA